MRRRIHAAVVSDVTLSLMSYEEEDTCHMRNRIHACILLLLI
jgi:hypothetical protein